MLGGGEGVGDDVASDASPTLPASQHSTAYSFDLAEDENLHTVSSVAQLHFTELRHATLFARISFVGIGLLGIHVAALTVHATASPITGAESSPVDAFVRTATLLVVDTGSALFVLLGATLCLAHRLSILTCTMAWLRDFALALWVDGAIAGIVLCITGCLCGLIAGWFRQEMIVWTLLDAALCTNVSSFAQEENLNPWFWMYHALFGVINIAHVCLRLGRGRTVATSNLQTLHLLAAAGLLITAAHALPVGYVQQPRMFHMFFTMTLPRLLESIAGVCLGLLFLEHEDDAQIAGKLFRRCIACVTLTLALTWTFELGQPLQLITADSCLYVAYRTSCLPLGQLVLPRGVSILCVAVALIVKPSVDIRAEVDADPVHQTRRLEDKTDVVVQRMQAMIILLQAVIFVMPVACLLHVLSDFMELKAFTAHNAIMVPIVWAAVGGTAFVYVDRVRSPGAREVERCVAYICGVGVYLYQRATCA